MAKALLVIPLPYDARTTFRMVSMVARRWEIEHRGQKMTTGHLQTVETQFGCSLVVWDAPVDAG